MIITIGGFAGQGINKISNTLAKAFVKIGYYVFNYRDYQSLIRGGLNYNSLNVCKEPKYIHSDKYIDYLVCLSKSCVEKFKNSDVKLAIVKKGLGNNFEKEIVVDTKKYIQKANAPALSENVVLISVLWRILGLEKEILKKQLKKDLKEEYNLKIVDLIFEDYKPQTKIETFDRKLLYINGSYAIALGSILAGLDLYFAYPMTPSTPVLHILAKLQKKYDIRVYQPENEIGVINMALGSSYAGAKVMIGTSGGGMALMSETISLAGMSEIPLVFYLAQRYAPATGIPTYTSQGDLMFVVNIGHGEFPRVVIAPKDHLSAIYRTKEAFYFAYKYRIISFIVSDKHLAESSATYSIDELDKYKNLEVDRFLDLEKKKDYKNYPIDNPLNKRSIPPMNMVKANSYEHDEYGITTEDEYYAKKMTERRHKKIKYILEEIEKMKPYTLIDNNSDKLIITWGSTYMALREVKDYDVLAIEYVYPLPNSLKKILEKYEEIIDVECNYNGLLRKLIAQRFGIMIEKVYTKYDARPFRIEDLEIKPERREII